MKKKIVALTAAAVMLFMMTGCGNKDSEKKSQIVDSENIASETLEPGATNAPKTEEEIQYEMDNFAKDADKNADLDKIPGTKLKGESDNDKADLGGYEVSINDAVLADSDDGKVVVVEFSFKNNTSADVTFSSVMKVVASQDRSNLPIAVRFSADGFEDMTQAQQVPYNDTIKVHKAYLLVDDSEPITIELMKNDTAGGSEILTKTFNIN